MALVTQPCVPVLKAEASSAKPLVDQPATKSVETIENSVPVESVNDSKPEDFETLQAEYDFLKAQEEMLSEMELLQDLQDQQQALMLFEVQSLANRTVPASSDRMPSS